MARGHSGVLVVTKPSASNPGAVERDPVKPRLRGVSHEYAFFVSLVAGAALIFAAPSARAAFAAAVYALSLSALFGVSALYHGVTWSVPVRRWMRRLDHSMIFLLIAGTYTPFGLLALSGTLAVVVLAVVWSGALVGMALNLIWIDAPKWFSAMVYTSLGWVAIVALPQLVSHIGSTATGRPEPGGVLYWARTAVSALRRPNPGTAASACHVVFTTHVTAAAG